MKIALLVTTPLPEEWRASAIFNHPDIILVNRLEELTEGSADVYFDFTPEPTEERLGFLATLLPATVFINAVTQTLSSMAMPFIRFNGWPGFGGGKIWELSAGQAQRARASELMTVLGQSYDFVSDVPGLVMPRIVTMIIAEAMMALQEGISSRESIDTAMRLGTGYPYGPFEWAEIIGRERILLLLRALEKSDPLYRKPLELNVL